MRVRRRVDAPAADVCNVSGGGGSVRGDVLFLRRRRACGRVAGVPGVGDWRRSGADSLGRQGALPCGGGDGLQFRAREMNTECGIAKSNARTIRISNRGVRITAVRRTGESDIIRNDIQSAVGST